MNKDLKGIILFAGLFLFICCLFYILMSFAILLGYTPLCTPNDEKEICLSIVLYILLTTKIFQVIGLIWMSLFGILKTKNPFIKKIFNSWSPPTVILLICFFADVSVNFLILYINENFYKDYIWTYNFYFSLSVNFLLIFIISILYQVIKLIKNKINQEKPWSARQRNPWQLL